MSKALGVLEEFAVPSSINREALMLDEGKVFNQWWKEDGGEGGDTGKRLRPGEFLRDAEGSWFRVYDVGGGKLRLAPVTEDGKLLAPKSQWKSPSGAFENELGQLVQTDLAGNITTSRTIPWSDWAGGSGGGGSTAWSSTQAAQTQADAAAMERLRAQIAQDKADLAENRRQFDIAQANDDRRLMQQLQAQIDLEEMRIENSQRELVYSMGMQERGTLIREKGAERERQVQLAGKDPFRFVASKYGYGTQGPTAFDAFKQEGREFINAPLPQVSMDMPIPQLEAALSGLQKLQAPQTGPFMGMADGGTIEMERGGDGAFSMKPKMSYLVGEGKHGEGLAAGTAEILTVGGGRVEVTPFGGGAQAGMNIPDIGGFSPLMSYLRGTTGAPGTMDTGWFGQSQVLPPSWAGALGYRQRGLGDLVGLGGSTAAYMMGPTGLRRLSDAPTGDVERLSMDAWKRLLGGTTRLENPFTMEQARNEMPMTGTPAFGAMTGVFDDPYLTVRDGLIQAGMSGPAASHLSNQIGFLAAPHKIAGRWGQLGPTEQSGVLSLYNLAGIPPEDFMDMVGAATPRAGAFGGRRIGFTGGVM